MSFVLPKLSFKNEGLEPLLSKETLDYHYGKHHQIYIDNLNKLIAGTENENKTIEEIIKVSEPGLLFNNASQSFNHTFYWNCLSREKSHKNNPSKELLETISKEFGSYESFKEQFSETAIKHFGSGWVWLAKNEQNKLVVKAMHDANSPIKDGEAPLLTIDVWEHAYYIDYRNNRAEYVAAFWRLVNWDFVEQQLSGASMASLMLNV